MAVCTAALLDKLHTPGITPFTLILVQGMLSLSLRLWPANVGSSSLRATSHSAGSMQGPHLQAPRQGQWLVLLHHLCVCRCRLQQGAAWVQVDHKHRDLHQRQHHQMEVLVSGLDITIDC